MQFLRTLFWVVLAVIAVIFAAKNWTPVTVHLWGGLEADTQLPILLFAAFLLGCLPYFVLHRATRWRLRRRLDQSERALAEARGPAVEEDSQSPALPAGAPPPAL